MFLRSNHRKKKIIAISASSRTIALLRTKPCSQPANQLPGAICTRCDPARFHGAREGSASTLHDVMYGKNHFSSMSIIADPEYNLAAAGVNDRQYPSYLAATNIVHAIVAGTDSGPTNGALCYATLNESTNRWFFDHIVNNPVNHPLRATLGHQVLYA